MSNINQLQDEIIEEFSDMDDWMDRYAYIIDLGNSLETLDESQKTPDNLIDGCQSRLWLDAQYSDGVVTYRADSDAIIVKGIVAMLIRVLSGPLLHRPNWAARPPFAHPQQRPAVDAQEDASLCHGVHAKGIASQAACARRVLL